MRDSYRSADRAGRPSAGRVGAEGGLSSRQVPVGQGFCPPSSELAYQQPLIATGSQRSSRAGRPAPGRCAHVGLASRDRVPAAAPQFFGLTTQQSHNGVTRDVTVGPKDRASSREDHRPFVARSSSGQTAETDCRRCRARPARRDDGEMVGCLAIWGRSALPVNGQILNYGASRAPFGARSNN